MKGRASDIGKVKDPVESARAVGLRYITDGTPGIIRRRSGKGFRYSGPDGNAVRDKGTLRRIASLAIPPAWKTVWICVDPNGHLQATGRDQRGRKQFRYHPRWREIRDETKFARMFQFALTLPRIRRRVARDLKLPGLPREKVLAAVVRLLEVSLIRVGNDDYAKNNGSFGLTTLRDKHVDVRGGNLRFHFRGKSGKWFQVDLHDPRLGSIVKKCQDLPGQELFQFVDDSGKRRDVRSDDVNAYLREISGRDFTAKDFRTWAGTMLAAVALRSFEDFDTKARAKRNVVAAIELVAKRLGNTPAVCRKCYVHPHLLDSYLDGTLASTTKSRAEKRSSARLNDLTGEEAAVLALLKQKQTLEMKLATAIRKEKQMRSRTSRPGRRVRKSRRAIP